MGNTDVLELIANDTVGDSLETDDATLIVGPRSVAVIPHDHYGERYELSR